MCGKNSRWVSRGHWGGGRGLASEKVAEYRDGQRMPCGQPACVQTQLCHILISLCLSFLLCRNQNGSPTTLVRLLWGLMSGPSVNTPFTLAANINLKARGSQSAELGVTQGSSQTCLCFSSCVFIVTCLLKNIT